MGSVATRLKQNWKSGLTVSLVSIPLSISLALAANATPLMGIITAIWAGLFAALFGGSAFNIVGPTGALSGVLATYAIVNGVEALPMLAIATGIATLVIYLLKWEKYIVFIPASVIHGFTLGVAFIIALNQPNFALGLKGLTVHERFIANIWESLQHLHLVEPMTLAIFLAGLIFLFLWLKAVPKFPGAIVLAPIGILLGYLSSAGHLPFTLQTLFTKFGDIRATLIDFPSFPTHILLTNSFLSTLVACTVIAILETLISAKIADGMTKTKFHRRKEVLGLALANMASGIMGGIPATAALARTALNVKSGANHQTSSMVNVICIALISLVFLPWFKFLPLSIVASILVYVAYRMVASEHFIHLFRHDKTAFWLSLFVAALTVIIDPIIGILAGACIALLVFVNTLAKGQSEITVNKKGKLLTRRLGKSLLTEKDQGDILVYRFAGPLVYMNSLPHIQMMENIRGPKTVILAFRNLFFVDIDGLDAIEEMVEILERKGITVMMSGVSELIEPMLQHAKCYKRALKQKQVFSKTTDAIKKLEHKTKKKQ